eukprot:TRINITY_DN9033_c0_g1_i1.p1 TRINITY_DN9033_c0_g1~~TRINITY_DN9033_c0_g1_i1.p1  ORF type:complete len:277 (-),score=64.74 TRINITY_DN9033_c0_g1_i1:60-890(-)
MSQRHKANSQEIPRESSTETKAPINGSVDLKRYVLFFLRHGRNLFRALPSSVQNIFGSTDPIPTLILSVFLGVIVGIGLAQFFLTQHFAGFGLFLVSFGLFHIFEYVFVAVYHPEKLSTDSFLLNHGLHYTLAFTVSLIEFFVELYFFPSLKTFGMINTIGAIITYGGHAIRLIAFVHGQRNFTHLVAESKVEGHTLVTSGIYSFMRHPGYFGFFWWSVGTQILLGNPLCVVAFFGASWLFFYDRIPAEEEYLVEFFGKDYIEYRKRVKTLIPFIP